MLVSVIVPVYNTQDYLDRCITALLGQTYKNIEIILVNDGSTDDSLGVSRKYQHQDSRVVVVDKENGGVSSARNAGIQVASGEYIMFVDSDDYVDKNYVKEMISAQLKWRDSLIICDLCGELNDGTRNSLHEEISEEGIFQLKDYYKFAKYHILNQPVNKIFSLRKLKEKGLVFKEDLPIAEDIYFNLEYLRECSSIFYVNRVLYFCLTDRGTSLCHKYYENLISINRRVFEKHVELFSVFQVNEEYKDQLILSHYGAHLDCLDREIIHSKSKKLMYANMKSIFRSDYFQFCLEHCRNEIPKIYYFILNSKSPRLYYLYHRLSELRRSR